VIAAEAGVGAAVVLTSSAMVIRRHRSRRAAVRQVRQALLDPDPSTRRAAVYVAADQGLAPYADLILERTREEHDKSVLAAMADAVARNRWEPADNRRLVELRTWAHQRLEEEPVTTINGNGNGNGHVKEKEKAVVPAYAVAELDGLLQKKEPPAAPRPAPAPRQTPTPTPTPSPTAAAGACPRYW
jgi:hypothetical protein